MLHIAPLTLKAQLCYLTGGSFLSLLLTLLGLLGWRSQDFFQPAIPGVPRTAGYTHVGMASLITFFTFAGVTVALVLETTHYYVRFAFHASHTGRGWTLHRHASIALQAAVGVLFVVIGITAVIQWAGDPAKCGFIFCLGVESHPSVATTRGAGFSLVLSLMMLGVLVPPGLVMLYRVYTLWPLQTASSTPADHDAKSHPTRNAPSARYFPTEISAATTGFQLLGTTEASGCNTELHHEQLSGDASTGKPASMQPYHAAPWKKQLCRIVGTSAGIVVCALLGFWLPNDPRHLSSYHIASFAHLRIVSDRRSSNTTVPELPRAWFRTGQIRVSENLNLKLFPGNVFFYVYLLATAVIVFVLRQTQRGRYWMQRRIPRCACFTYGEAAFVVSTLLLTVLFAIYWLHDHNYKSSWSTTKPTNAIDNPERWGRGLGQLAILFLSLLLLPVGRQSVVVTVLGVSRDGLLWFHRAVGYAMLAATIGHIVAFYVSYAQYGQLLHNLNKIPSIVGKKGVFDDFTVVVATWTTWFLLIAMGIFGLNFMRRRYYELFYYTHLAATYMTLPVMLLHAAAGWMYLLPGMTLLVADQAVRLWQRSAVVRVVHARVISEDTTELAFSVPGRWDMRTVHPGQYVFVCVPELTALQWHPFTLTSVVDEESLPGADREVSATGTVFYVHIKSMGPKTWTGRLHDLARTGTAFSMSVEGPCGTPVDYRRYDDIVLVAGGIGAAPCVSVYGSLLREHVRCGGCVPRVRLVWSTRSASLVGAVADMLQLPASYRGLVKEPVADTPGKGRENGAVRGTAVEVAAAPHLADGVFTCDIFVTRRGELQRFAPVSAPDGSAQALVGVLESMSSASLAGGDHGGGGGGEGEAKRVTQRETWLLEESPVLECVRSTEGAAEVTSMLNRGGRLRVQEGRPDVAGEIMRALTDASTGCVVGDVARKLVLVCGPEGMVADAAAAAAAIGVVVHSEEFLF